MNASTKDIHLLENFLAATYYVARGDEGDALQVMANCRSWRNAVARASPGGVLAQYTRVHIIRNP